MAYRAEQRRRFKAVLCGANGEPIQSSPRKVKSAGAETDITEQEQSRRLDGFYLVSQTYCIQTCTTSPRTFPLCFH